MPLMRTLEGVIMASLQPRRHFLVFWLTLSLFACRTPHSLGQSTAQPASCATYPGFYSGDYSLSGYDSLASPSQGDCCSQCAAIPSCGAWVWKASTKTCSLEASVSSTSSVYASSDYTLGIKRADIVSSPATISAPSFAPGSLPLWVTGSATFSEATLTLTYDLQQRGAALLLSPVQVLRDMSGKCEAASFSAAFSFQLIVNPTTPPGNGFAFLVLSSETPFEGVGSRASSSDSSSDLGFSTSSSAPVTQQPGAVAVEFDTLKNVEVGDPDDSHVGVNLQYSARSLATAATAAAGVRLQDYSVKYAWVDYDAAAASLNVFLSYVASKPAKPLLVTPLSLCTALRPPACSSCSSATSVYLGFSAATSSGNYQNTIISSWSFQSSWPAKQPGTAPPAEKCSAVVGCSIEGFDLAPYVGLSSPSAQDCCIKCAAQPACLAYVWKPSKRCDLKTLGDAIVQDGSTFVCGEKARLPSRVPLALAVAPGRFASANKHILLGSALYTDGVLKLAYSPSQLGVALLTQPVQLLRDREAGCEAASFSATFAFNAHDPSSSSGWGEGFTFFVAGASLPLGSLGDAGGYTMGYSAKGGVFVPGSLAVEFDAVQSSELEDSPLELEAGHVGVNLQWSLQSVAAVTMASQGLAYNDSRTKYAWVDYDVDLGALHVFLSYRGVKPLFPALTQELDLCELLRPPTCRTCQTTVSALVGFTAATSYYYSQYSDILSFQMTTSWGDGDPDAGPFTLGLVPSGVRPQRQNAFFRHASMGYLSQDGGQGRDPSWLVAIRWNWTVDAVAPIRDQKGCRACHIFAALGAMESAYFLTFYKGRGSTLPDMAEQQLVDCQGGCQGGWPPSSLDYAASVPLVADSSYAYTGSSKACRIPKKAAAKYQLTSFDAVSFMGWFGLVLAVQQSPVIVNIEASSSSFIAYKGGIYADPECYAGGVDHSVVIVGYDLLSSPPFFILRNSWGTRWGERGYMRMAIQAGDGVCGINTMPAYQPVFRAEDACNTQNYPRQTGLRTPDAAPGRLNPCGGGDCANAAAGRNTCSCPVDFVTATNSDGSQTCVPAKPCTFLGSSPCGVGTCLDSASTLGTYTCLCPLGYEQGTVALDGSPTCVPAVLVPGPKVYTVPAGFSVTCARVAEVYGLLQASFLALNKGLDCKKALRAGTRVTVTNNILNGCQLPYAVNEADSCKSIAKLFGIRVLDGRGSPNPELDCNRLQPGQQVCIQRRASQNTAPPDVPLCTAFFTSQASDTCASVIYNKFGGDAAAFFTLNPGLYCNNFNRFKFERVTTLGTLGQQVCTAATTLGAIQKGCRGKLVSVQAGETCLSLQKRHFCTKRRLIAKYNRNWRCSNSKLFVSGQNSRLRLCAPTSCP